MAGYTNKDQANSLVESWVICKSKSHSGKPYYFNPLTGAACWNLSIEEIQKAKHWTKSLASTGHVEPREPSEPPAEMDNSMNLSSNINNNNTSLTAYNTQIGNNQFTGHSMPVSPFIVPPCVNAVNSLIPFAVNSPLGVPAFNSNVWAVPPGQPIYLTPAVPSLLNQAQAPVNVTFNSQESFVNVDSTAKTGPDSFRNLQTEHNNTSQKKYEQRSLFPEWSQNANRQNPIFERNLRKNLSSNDLRNYLCSKKNKKNITEDNNKVSENGHASNCKNEEVYNNLPKLKETTDHRLVTHNNEKDDDVDADSDWLEENIIFQGRQLKLNISNIKKLAKPNVDPECWFIVTDETILLNHLNFLNTLCNSDNLCQLMVPQQVMLLLREQAYSGQNNKVTNRARRALAFIKQLFDFNYVIIGEGVSADNTKSGILLDCCLTLSQQNYLVILLSNNEEIKSHANGSKVPHFSIKEIKKFLERSEQDSDSEKVPISPNFITKPIKITVSNELLQDPDFGKLEESTPENEPVADELEEPSTMSAMDQSEVSPPVTSLSPIKTHALECTPTETFVLEEPDSASMIPQTIETGFQEELPQVPQQSPDISQNLLNSPKKSSTTKSEPGDESSLNDTQYKKREIRLKRDASNKKPINTEETLSDMKKFKWRKRRPTANSSSENRMLSDNKTDNNLVDKESIQDQTKVTEEYSQGKVQENEICSSRTSNNMIDHVPIDENREGRSEASKKVETDNIVVDETSTSGIVSNATSNVDSEYDKKLNDFNQSDPKELDNNTMFVVKDQNMEDYLLMRCDEWVSRFLQIFEEVLTQVLRQDQRFLSDVVYKLHGGGPWTIKEAIDCVKRKFIKNLDIVDAANKLENIFLKISDETGRIDKNLQPSQYMEMYSYGVGLVEQLQSVFSNCEDLSTAAESLKKLLHDIQNPNVDCSHNEVFENNPQIVLENTGRPNDVNTSSTATQPSPTKNGKNVSPQKLSYNLRSRNKSLSQENKPTPPIGQNNDITEKSFFSTLNLQKTSNEKSVPDSTHDSSSFGTCQGTQQESTFNLSDKCVDEYDKAYTSNVQPTVIRKFTICPEFEKRMSGLARQTLDLDALDYTANMDDGGDNMEDDYYSDCELNQLPLDDQDEGQQHIHENSTIKDSDRTSIESDPKRFNGDTPVNVNDELNSVFYTILAEIKARLLEIHVYCTGARDALSYDLISNNRKMEMLNEAQKVRLLIDSLFDSLNSTYCRETYDRENNIQSLLISVGINDLDLNHNQLHVYRDVIGKFLEQAKILKESIVLIIKTLNNKPVS